MNDPKHMVTSRGGYKEPLSLCGLMSYPTGGITIHRDDVTCLDCLKQLKATDEDDEVSFVPPKS